MTDHTTPLSGKTNQSPSTESDHKKTFVESKKQVQGAFGTASMAGLTFLSLDHLVALGAPWPVLAALIFLTGIPSVIAQVSEAIIDLKRASIPHDAPLSSRKDV
jgi:hypothetical protein